MTELLSQNALSDLIGSIYDCVIDPAHWEPTLARIASAADCAFASLTLNDLRRDRFLLNKASGWDAFLLKVKSDRHVPEINARLTEWLAGQQTLDEPFVTSRHLSPDYIRSSGYVRECLAPQGIVDIMHVFLMYTPTQFAELGLGRHERQGAITEREVAIGRLLLPHLRRALTISNLLDVATIERMHMAETLDSLRCGVILTDRRGAVLHANRAAGDMLRKGAPVKDAGGVLSAANMAASRELRSAIALATDESRLGRTGLAIRVSSAEDAPVYAHVLPISGSDLRTRLQPDAVAAIFIGTPPQPEGLRLLAAAFELTAAETRVLEGLLAGRTLSETAAHLGIAPSTAKTHLDHIFAKAGVSRQTELIRLAMQLTLPVQRSPS
ncbi:DNA-binding CsgD family transcriptional regulator/PAS domain-containing protein [Microvirga flocculans]|uniref:DNA-binding CsgD family transcriptional regulator/PAS domain-containing protein n=1 Tax=Microvirga flocculans TaxID=217168 RepID=A0A7W6N760_9HYPH|nr:LuxR C-terminal-related transcriptional regulator [Microvirga flocculans]MBB4039301.1 DNA-binding CsgD family transcriptional regulator/PAS domain-containing protein [Microvirga flocculans]